MSTTATTALLTFDRYFTQEGIHPYESVSWVRRDAKITRGDGSDVFFQPDVEVPATWSENATNIVASKYFRGYLGTPARESSVKQMVRRVVETIRQWGVIDGYFDINTSHIFADELTYMLIHQMVSFNSPVWFNIGVDGAPQQASACFILDVEDSIDSIYEWYRQEGLIFKGGSGAGINVSKIRGLGEPLSGGGVASGPLSFMKVADSGAGSIKSGGRTRRSAKMVMMDVEHPDIAQFIWCKTQEEAKAKVLIAGGYDATIDGDAYSTVAHQNANYSVTVPDTFMHAVRTGGMFSTRYVGSGEICQTLSAQAIFRAMAEAAHRCGCPGVFFRDTVNTWHTTPGRGRIVSSNPCNEFHRPPNEACNLASFNLLAFLDATNTFQIARFQRAVHLMITAMDILVSRADYPTPAITKNSHDYRPLGLGYNNLGGLLLATGVPYDSEAGRAIAASITALMSGEAYAQSARLAQVKGAFAGFQPDREVMLGVIQKHGQAVLHIGYPQTQFNLVETTQAAADAWVSAIERGEEYGYRNCQVAVLQPGGTVSFMMDCNTTGIEPFLGLASTKTLAGGGSLSLMNNLVWRGLKSLGYDVHIIEGVLSSIKATGDIDVRLLDAKDVSVFDCAFPGPNGRSIDWRGHIAMCAAVQPFLSGGISKTINMPHDATVDDVVEAYMLAWESGLKAVAIYRDGSKQVQPVSVTTSQPQALVTTDPTPAPVKPHRKRLPDERPAVIHKFSLNGHEGYINVGLYPDTHHPGELFITMAKEGSTISGLMDAFATSISLLLQYGVPLADLCDKFTGMRFEPAGFTGNPDIPLAQSLMDYLFRWMSRKFLPGEEVPVVSHGSIMHTLAASAQGIVGTPLPPNLSTGENVLMNGRRPLSHAPTCSECGNLMVPSGTCFTCPACGTSGGCG